VICNVYVLFFVDVFTDPFVCIRPVFQQYRQCPTSCNLWVEDTMTETVQNNLSKDQHVC